MTEENNNPKDNNPALQNHVCRFNDGGHHCECFLEGQRATLETPVQSKASKEEWEEKWFKLKLYSDTLPWEEEEFNEKKRKEFIQTLLTTERQKAREAALKEVLQIAKDTWRS
jgi:hypothetical protein